MELPKNITQIGETNPHCKVYVEDYVISYIKQLNQYAGEKEMAVALYGTRKEEAGITYLFLYGASRLVFLQKECRHLSQAVQQEAEKQRKKYFPDSVFLGYRLLDGEMVEGFHICEQGVCRYVEGYAQFYEKNDAMLAFMLEERQEAAQPETVDQEKYNVVKRRQEERRALAGEKGGHAVWPRHRQSWQQAPQPEDQPMPQPDGQSVPQPMGQALRKPVRRSIRKQGQYAASAENPAPAANGSSLRGMKLAAAAVFALLCVSGLALMGDSENVEGWQMAVRQLMENMSEKQLPDAIPASNGSAQVGTIVAEDKLTDAIRQENAASDINASQPGAGQGDGQDEQESGEEAQGQASSQGTAQFPDQSSNQDPGQTVSQENAQDPGQAGGQETAANPGGGDGQTNAQEANQDTGQAPGQETAQPSGQGTVQEAQPSGQENEPDQSAGQPAAQEPDQQPDAQPAAGPTVELVSYIVQRGDTLIGICVEKYGTDTRVSEICSLNNIQDPDDIKVGEKIFLPQ